MRISDWSSDVCSSDLIVKCAHIEISIDGRDQPALQLGFPCVRRTMSDCARDTADKLIGKALPKCIEHAGFAAEILVEGSFGDTGAFGNVINSRGVHALRAEEQPSELQPLMRISYA